MPRERSRLTGRRCQDSVWILSVLKGDIKGLGGRDSPLESRDSYESKLWEGWHSGE